MSFQKFRSDAFCVGGRHRSATTKTGGNITSKDTKVTIGFVQFVIEKTYDC